MIVAISGPDGSGKSTLSKLLSERGWAVRYGGKKANHSLLVTRLAFRVYEALNRPRLGYARLLFRILVLYPIEYFENLNRLRAARAIRSRGRGLAFDRFGIDRIWPAYVSQDCRMHVSGFVGLYWRLLASLYTNVIRGVDLNVLLLPPTATLLRRAPGEYRSNAHCECVRQAYLRAAPELRRRGIRVVTIVDDLPPEALLHTLEGDLKLYDMDSD